MELDVRYIVKVELVEVVAFLMTNFIDINLINICNIGDNE